MDSFDIIWLVICIGLPIISGIVSSLQKVKKAQNGIPNTFPDDFNTEDVFGKSEVVEGDNDFFSDESDKYEPIVSAPPTRSSATKKQKAKKQSPKVQKVLKTPKAPILIEDNEQENKEEDIELRKMIIYSIIMEPKFKE